MDERLSRLLDELYRRNESHDAQLSDRLARWRTVEPETARLLAVVVRARAPHRLLELGTSSGYSTIWLADAARAVGGSLTSVELEPARTAAARENLAAAGLVDDVVLRTDDAGAVLAASAADAWDFVFLDAERPYYAGYWPDLRRTLAPRGLLVVDNVISHAEQVAEFRALVDGDRTVTQALAPTGAGALLVIAD